MAAKNYTEILALVNAGNQMGLSNTIKRDYGIPLDFTSVQPSYDDAVIYAAENTKAYVGQPLSVGGKLYIINDVAAETKYVVGDKEYDNYLVEVGSATEGDGVTIDLEAGVLTLHGFESALTGYLPRKAENGSLEWVPISTVVQGDGNKVTTLTSEDGSVTITKKTDTDASLVYDLSVEAYDDTDVKGRLDAVEEAIGEEAEGENEATGLYKAIADAEARAKAYADENDTDTVYDDTALAGRVTTVEDKVTALEQAVEAIDYVDADELADAIKDFATTDYVNTELAKKAAADDLTALTNRVDAFLTGTGATEALDSLQELIKYINEHDDVEISGILADIEAIEGKLEGIDTTVVAYVTAAIDALKIGDYAKAADLTALAGRVETLEAKPFDTYATKSEVEAVDAKFAGYTNTEALNRLLSAKADADTVANTYATKQELADHASDMEDTLEAALAPYAKTADVNAELVKKIENATIAHAVAAVEADPEKGIEAVEGIPEGVTKEGTTLKIVIDAPTRAETIKMIADKVADVTGGESAADVKLSLEAEVERSTAKDTAHDNALAILQGAESVSGSVAEAKALAQKGVTDAATAQTKANEAVAQANTNKDDIAAVKGRLTTLETAKGDHETRIAAAEGKITSLETATGNNATAIGQLQGKDEELVAEDARLAGLISTLQSDKADKSDTYTKSEVDTKVQEAINAIPDVDFTGYATETYVTDAIAVVNTEVAKKVNADKVYSKTDADAKFQTEAQVKAIVDKVVADVSDTDTIEGLVTLVNYVHDNAGDIAELISDVETNRTDIESNTAAISKNASDIAALIATVAAQKVVESTEVSVTTVESGVSLGIKEVNVNKLVQTEGDVFILNGGTSTN